MLRFSRVKKIKYLLLFIAEIVCVLENKVLIICNLNC